MKNFLLDMKQSFQLEPIGTTWRLLMSPITATLLLLGYLCVGLSQLLAYGKWRSLE